MTGRVSMGVGRGVPMSQATFEKYPCHMSLSLRNMCPFFKKIPVTIYIMYNIYYPPEVRRGEYFCCNTVALQLPKHKYSWEVKNKKK